MRDHPSLNMDVLLSPLCLLVQVVRFYLQSYSSLVVTILIEWTLTTIRLFCHL